MRFTAARLALPAAVAIAFLVATVAVAPPPAAAQAAENGTTSLAFDLQADGDARVTVTLRLALDGAEGRQAFDQLAEEHTAGEDSPLSVEPFERAAALASEETGRPMAVEDVTYTADRTDGTGHLGLSFTWTNFTNVSDGRMVLGDVFQRPGGTWLAGLEAGQELRISYPEQYSTQDISIPGTRFQVVNRTVHVEGPTSFEPGTPAIVLERPGATTTPGPSGVPAEAVLGGVALLLVVALVGGVYHFRNRLPEFGGSEAAGGVGSGSGADPSDVDPMAEPLLSDEERVLRLLERQDGRMKQVEIVEETDWSNAKVSQLLTEMAEAGKVDKLRIGRENLISLPGRGPGDE